jgi:hypothetical protein
MSAHAEFLMSVVTSRHTNASGPLAGRLEDVQKVLTNTTQLRCPAPLGVTYWLRRMRRHFKELVERRDRAPSPRGLAELEKSFYLHDQTLHQSD